MRRAEIGLLAFGLLIGTAIAATGSSGTELDESAPGHGPFVRWDLVQFVGGVVLVGGTDVSTDAATDHTIKLTGSGHAEPLEAEAAGGGTFVHKRANGSIRAQGAYQVTKFLNWRPLAGGSLEGTGLIDGIGNGTGAHPNEHEESSGVLRLRVRFIPVVNGEPQPGFGGRLIIFCHLPGTVVDVPEGVRVVVPRFDLDFQPTSGFTLFHRLR